MSTVPSDTSSKTAVLNVALDVDTNGKADKCNVESSTASPEIDAAVCRNLLAKANFNPKLDENGKPVRWVFKRRVTFQIKD
ncbi:energy transducer TonB [Sphingomonas sp. Leaf67]|uniref:energy transducer TonB n=1 Tax=Sphingomonas sp. Leaf67 TaxID=1736230 RepID=UPI000B075946|nr:TonB family protein [Sphingomonas sp. Leaf67]